MTKSSVAFRNSRKMPAFFRLFLKFHLTHSIRKENHMKKKGTFCYEYRKSKKP